MAVMAHRHRTDKPVRVRVAPKAEWKARIQAVAAKV